MAGKKISPDYLERAAFHYLGRYSSSAANLEEVLVRKVRRRKEDGAMPSDEERDWIRSVREKCERLGLVDDAEYARARVASMNRSGKPARHIRQALRHKGVAAEIIENALQNLDVELNEQSDWLAALAYARKRRFGPWRRCDGDPDKRRRELASMARAGHGWGYANRIVNAGDPESLEENFQEKRPYPSGFA